MNSFRNSLALVLSLATLNVIAQSNLEKVLRATDVEGLRRDAKISDSLFHLKHAEALRLAQINNWPITLEDGINFKELMYIDEQGMPVYLETENDKSAITINTDEVHPGGSSGLNLMGTGMKVAVWDGGAVRATHQEFAGSGRLSQIDGASTISNHATHVAGTVGATGFVARAKGMAYDADIQAYDWSNNENEMRTAGGNGLLVSNHSYGQPTGWSVSGGNWTWYGNPNEDAREDIDFGHYGNVAREWDQIANQAPYHLIVKSSGNDRDDGPSPGTSHRVWNGSSWGTSTATRDDDPSYGSVSSYSMAKNILVVGAVNEISNGYSQPSNVVMSNFSCWGPTDDGRIRPDIVSKGVSVYSPLGGSNTQYASWNGTSMASPAVTGSSILLQERYEQVHGSGNFMRSSTLRGLIIHTANEAGTHPGPDYKFGWGLMNTRKASELIGDTTALIMEERLTSGVPIEIKAVNIPNRVIRVSIAWNDPAGAVAARVLNPTTQDLVHDLDLRIERESDGFEFKPYVLNPALPADPATTGDNFRDNVEQVYIASPSNGVYTLKIGNKGTLSSQQWVSIIVEGLAPLPIPAFTISANSICIGDSVQLFNSSEDASSYSWDFGGASGNQNDENPTVHFNAAGSYDIKLVVSNQNGSDSLIKTGSVVVHGSPSVQIDRSDLTFCTANSQAQSIGANFKGGTWDGGSWMPFTDTVLFVPSSMNLGSYPLSYDYTDSIGCSGSDSVEVSFVSSPAVELDSMGPYCNTSAAFSLMTGSPSGGTFTIDGLPDSIFNPAVVGVGWHQVEYTYSDSNSCSGSSLQFVEIYNCVSVEELNSDGLRIFPNPSSGKFKLEFEAEVNKLTVRNHLGQLIRENESVDSGFLLDLSHESKGIYFVDLTLSSGKHIQKSISLN